MEAEPSLRGRFAPWWWAHGETVRHSSRTERVAALRALCAADEPHRRPIATNAQPQACSQAPRTGSPHVDAARRGRCSHGDLLAQAMAQFDGFVGRIGRRVTSASSSRTVLPYAEERHGGMVTRRRRCMADVTKATRRDARSQSLALTPSPGEMRDAAARPRSSTATLRRRVIGWVSDGHAANAQNARASDALAHGKQALSIRNEE